MSKQKVSFYIDGFNFYFGIRSQWKRKYYWLDMVKFCESMLKPHQELVLVYYFSAPQTGSSRKRQNAFFSANKTNAKFKLEMGEYKKKNVILIEGHKGTVFEEKKTDVNIVVQMIRDAVFNNVDASILISGDTDTLPGFKLIREINSKHKIYTFFPPRRFNNELMINADGVVDLARFEARFKKCMLPEEVTLSNGTIIKRPESWE